MSNAKSESWEIREMREEEVDAVVDGVFRACPTIDRGEPSPSTFGGRGVDFSPGGMVKEEVGSMFSGVRYGMPFETKTVVALLDGRLLGSVSMYRGSPNWQLGYFVRPATEDSEQVVQELGEAITTVCEVWGASPGCVPREHPPWFYV